MLFNSLTYTVLFLPAVLLGFYWIAKLNQPLAARLLLLASSIFFYSYWKLGYLPLLVLSVLVNYSFGLLISKLDTPRLKSTTLFIAVTFNLALLGYYKYFDFIIENLNAVGDYSFTATRLILPLAISFYTFQQIAYLVDTYKGQTKRMGFINYALFVTFFPQLIAGPIVHHSKLVPQFSKTGFLDINRQNLKDGLLLFAIGLVKKSVIADSLAPVVNSGFANWHVLTSYEAVIVALAFSMQLYFDFSGYTDMAMGSARMFNIKLPLNFNSPYKARNIRDFWRRWHITLNDFMSRYVYGPLRGKRKNPIRVYAGIFVTFFLVGIWHGSGWTFVVFGVLHGLAVVWIAATERFKYTLPPVLAIALTYLFVVCSEILFRAPTVEVAAHFIKLMFSPDHWMAFINLWQQSTGIHDLEIYQNLNTNSGIVFILFICLFIVFCTRNSTELLKSQFTQRHLPLFACTLLAIACFIDTSQSEFIYFNF